MPGAKLEKCLPALRQEQFGDLREQIPKSVQSQHHVPVPKFCHWRGGVAVTERSSSAPLGDIVVLDKECVFSEIAASLLIPL